MNQIPAAQNIEFKPESENKGQFIIEPLYPGYGLTVGNALRRVLLSSLEGCAISSIRIKGVEHEFSTIEGVKEDVVDIILNLKQIRFEVSDKIELPAKLELTAKGEKEVTAKDFKTVTGIKVSNPDQLIATLTDKKSDFEMEVWIEKGRGFLPVEMMKDKENEIGVIAIDAFFTPIKKVAIDTENVRVGDMTNWDKLILSVETDGSITCQDALQKAGEILVNQFEIFKSSAETKSVKKSSNKKTANTENSEKSESTEEISESSE